MRCSKENIRSPRWQPRAARVAQLAERLRRLEVDDHFELGRRLLGRSEGFVAAHDAVDIWRGLPVHVDKVGPIGDETTGCENTRNYATVGKPVLSRERELDQVKNPASLCRVENSGWDLVSYQARITLEL